MKVKKIIYILIIFIVVFSFTMITNAESDDFVMVETGNTHTMAIKSDNSLWVWGSNYGQFGNGTTRSSHTPIKVMDDVIQISAGDGYSTAIKKSGSLLTWGRNNDQ